MGLTKKVLKRPVTTILVVLCLIVFGLSSVFSSRLELTPEMEMPMLVVNAIYPGASPDDVEELVTKLIEDEVGTLSGVDSVTSMSAENYAIVLMQYDYGQDMDKAYDDLKKKLDGLANDFPYRRPPLLRWILTTPRPWCWQSITIMLIICMIM